MLVVTNIIIRCGKAYIPTIARTYGPYVFVEPIYVTNLVVSDLLEVLTALIQRGHSHLGVNTTRDFWQNRDDPVLTATKLKSWKQLARDSASYSIEWEKQRILLFLHALDKQGRFVATPERSISFFNQTPLSTVLDALLEDVHRLPEQGYLDVTRPCKA